MDAQTALANIMSILNVTTPDAAVDRVQQLTANAPVIGVNSAGQLVTAPNMTIGQALQLLEAARNTILGAKLS